MNMSGIVIIGVMMINSITSTFTYTSKPCLYGFAARPSIAQVRFGAHGAIAQRLAAQGFLRILYHEASKPCLYGFAARPSIAQVRFGARGATAQRLAAQGFLRVLYHKKEVLVSLFGKLGLLFLG